MSKRAEAREHDPAETSADDPGADTPSYEQARDELIEVVRQLEAGGTTLEESLRLWERGEELARICQNWLEGARARLEAATGEAGQADEVEDLDRDV